MSHTTEKSVVGRKPFAAIKLSLDYCTRTYGVGSCTAGRDASGTAQAGGTNTVTLAASDTYGNDELIGFAVYIATGTGAGQEGIITTNDSTSKVAVVSEDWSTQPDPTSGYVLINRPNACYNTRANCQDTANYDPSETENEVWVTTPTSDFPINIWDESNVGVVVPALKSKGISATPPKIDIAGGLGQRASISANCVDFTHHDRGLDKYVESRSYVPENQGTFWGKFLARNKYYQGRTLTYYDGYLVSGSFDTVNFHSRVYIIEKMTGPDTKGMVSILAKDVMKLADSDRSFAPLPSSGTLALDLASGETGSMTLLSGSGGDYPSGGGSVRVNSEIITYASRSGDVLSTLTRAAWGTTADDHSTDDTVQLCLTYENVNVVDIIEDLYSTYASIPSAYIPSSDWAIEKSTYLSSNTLTTIISEPTGVNKLVKELVQENLIYMWWADHLQEVKLKAYAPVGSTTTVTDSNSILANSASIWHDPNLRVSQFWLYYGVRDYTDKGYDNFKYLYAQVDTDTESDAKYGETRRRKLESRWMTEANAGLVIQSASRTLSILSETPRLAKFRLDAKDEVETGDFVTLESRLIQDADGSSLSLDMLVIEKRQVENGTTYEYTAQEFLFTGRYAYIGPDSLPDYSADVIAQQNGDPLLLESGGFILLEDALVTSGATDAQKDRYAWIAPDSGYFANGDEAYKIL